MSAEWTKQRIARAELYRAMDNAITTLSSVMRELTLDGQGFDLARADSDDLGRCFTKVLVLVGEVMHAQRKP